MASQIKPFSISAPGFLGLNTSDSPVELNQNYALVATNCVIDRSGRIASRKGWEQGHSTSADLGTADVTCIGEVIQNDGTSTIVCTGNAKLYKLTSGSPNTLTTLTYGGGGVAPTISANNWMFCQLNGVGIFWQSAHDPLIFDPTVSTTTYRRLNEKSGTLGTVYQCNVAISAYGRIWAADTTTDKQTVVFSDMLTPHIWTGGTSGSLDLRQVWPSGGDEIIGFAAHNDFLIIFGKFQTIIYSGPQDPATMQLHDAIVGVGCIARDSIQNTGQDVLFLSDKGVQSLGRVIQEKSAPMVQASLNVNGDIQEYVDASTLTAVKSGYSAMNNFYLLCFPAFDLTYCFDTRQPSPTGGLRVTTWNLAVASFYETVSRKFYLGMPGYIGLHKDYLDNTSTYRMSYYTTWIDFGDPIRLTILKKIMLLINASSNQNVVFKWAYDFNPTYFSANDSISDRGDPMEWGSFEWNDGSEWGVVPYEIETLSVNGQSHGRVLQFGFESEINDTSMAVQKIDLISKDGGYAS